MPLFQISRETTRLWRIPLDRRELELALGGFGRTLTERGWVLPERIALRLADDAHVAGANARCMACSGPTNILTFPGDASLPGELLLSLDTWERECRFYHQPPLRHLLRLLAHGMAHMAGLDHSPEMTSLEQACLRAWNTNHENTRSAPAQRGKSGTMHSPKPGFRPLPPGAPLLR